MLTFLFLLDKIMSKKATFSRRGLVRTDVTGWSKYREFYYVVKTIFRKLVINPFQPNIPFIPPKSQMFSVGIELEHWAKMGYQAWLWASFLLWKKREIYLNKPFITFLYAVFQRLTHNKSYETYKSLSSLHSSQQHADGCRLFW